MIGTITSLWKNTPSVPSRKTDRQTKSYMCLIIWSEDKYTTRNTSTYLKIFIDFLAIGLGSSLCRYHWNMVSQSPLIIGILGDIFIDNKIYLFVKDSKTSQQWLSTSSVKLFRYRKYVLECDSEQLFQIWLVDSQTCCKEHLVWLLISSPKLQT